MSRRAKIWMAVAVVFTLGNVGGGIFAAAQGEGMHAGLHAALTVAGLLWMLLIARSQGRDAAFATAGMSASPPSDITDRLSQLEHSVDAVAIEVERIGEGQRFMTRVLTQDKAPLDARPADAAPAPVRRDDNGK